MTAVVYELMDSESGSITGEPGQAEVREYKRRLVVGRSSSFERAFTDVKPYVPRYLTSSYSGAYYVRKKVDITSIGNQYFDVTAQYATLVTTAEGLSPGEPGEYTPGSVAFDTIGRTEHRTQAYAERKVPFSADGMEKAINVSGESVNGIDVVVPGMRYSETWIIPIQTAMSAEFINAVYTLTGTVNQFPFRVFEPGEALFLGARGQWGEDQPFVPVTFEFEARAKTVDEYITGLNAGVDGTYSKDGWEYLWIRYEDAVEGDSLIRRPKAAYINEIYKKKDWAPLLIGSGPIAAPRAGVSATDAAVFGGGFS